MIAWGLTRGEVAAPFDDVDGASVSKDTLSKIADKAIEETTDRHRRVYPAVFIDTIVMRVRDGQVRNKPFHVTVDVTKRGERSILRSWAGDGSEDAKFWLGVLALDQEPGCSRGVHRRLRRDEGPSGRDR